MIGIYRITNLINNKSYIGQSCDINHRLKEHFRGVGSYAIHKAIEKYGKENFKVEILVECLRQDLNTFEEKFINSYNTLAPNGYNLKSGGNQNIRFSEESIYKIKKNHAPCSGENHPLYGKKRSVETIEKQRAARLGKKASIETRQKISASLKGHVGYWKGKHRTSEYRENQSKKTKGIPKVKIDALILSTNQIVTMNISHLEQWHKNDYEILNP